MIKTIVENIYREHNLKLILKKHSKLKNVRYILINMSDLPIIYCEFNRFATIDTETLYNCHEQYATPSILPVGTVYTPINPNSTRIVIPSIWTEDHPYKLNTLLLGTDITDLKRNVVELSFNKQHKTIDFVLYANSTEGLTPIDENNDLYLDNKNKLNINIVIMKNLSAIGYISHSH